MNRISSSLVEMNTPYVVPMNACWSIMAKKIKKTMGANTQPCFTTLAMLKGIDIDKSNPLVPSCFCGTIQKVIDLRLATYKLENLK